MWILWILGGFVALAIVFMAFLQVSQMIGDRQGIRLGREYISRTDFDYLETKLYSGHYRVYFKANGKRMHANYRAQGSEILWISGTPEERAQKRSKVKK